jgi:sugar phosphate isomerase/epimerase
MRNKFAAQLYTLREELKKDVPGVFREVKKMGWGGVQISALPSGYDAKEIADVLQETGLGTAGIHIALDRLQNDLDTVLEEAKIWNTRDLVCPSLPKELQNAEGFVKVRNILNEVADKVASQGFRVSYHNHAFEFESEIDGKSGLEYILEPSSENNVLAEVDVFWVKKGGRDPLSFIQPYNNRMPIIHLKDMTNDERQTFAEVGTGTIEFAPILEWGEQSGVEWYAVEQDVCPGNPMDSLQISLDNLNKLALQLQK